MRPSFLMTLLLTTSLACAGTASAVEPEIGAPMGTTLQEIETALSEEGLAMTRFDRSGPWIEVYAISDNRRYEFYIDPATGQIVDLDQFLRRGPSPRPGASDESIRARLTNLGFEIIHYDRDRGEIEVYARRDGRLWEIEIHPGSGEILEVEVED